MKKKMGREYFVTKLCTTFIAEKTSPVDWEIPPTMTISFSTVMLAILDPYLDIGVLNGTIGAY